MGFTDMMSSGRGAGVIGSIMAVVVLGGFVLLFVLVFDEGLQGGGETIESVIASQAKEIEVYESRIDDAAARLEKVPVLKKIATELASVERENTFRAAEIKGLSDGVDVLEKQIDARGVEFYDYKNRYRQYVREKAVGIKYPELKTVDGTVYKDVEVREVTAVGVQIRHDAGQKRIPFEDLSEEMQDYYQFDPDQKQEALVAEEIRHKAHEAEVALANEAHDRAAAAQKERDAEAARQKLLRDLSTAETRAVQLRQEIDALKNEIRAENNKRGIRRTGVLQPQLQAKERQLSALESDIRRMKANH